jgi:GT2 family glycosyltransferase
MDLSIIIVNWNSKEYLRKCLASIRAQPGVPDQEIVVIDSASHDGAGQMLAEHFPEVRFIQANRNLGFARANNDAFDVSTGRHVLFLNPDTEVVGSAVATMIERLRTLPDAGSVGCRLVNGDGTVQTSCIQSMPTILNQVLDCEFLRARSLKSGLWGMAPLYTDRDQPSAVEAISGACVMLKREVFERVGRFSEDYFMYAEDMDLSYKVTQAGYRNYYLPSATVVHHGGGSSARAANNFSTVMLREAIWRFLRKTRGRAYALGYRAGMFVTALVRLALLVVGYPVHSICRCGSDWAGSLRKWSAVVRWSVFPQELVRQHPQQLQPLPRSSFRICMNGLFNRMRPAKRSNPRRRYAFKRSRE